MKIQKITQKKIKFSVSKIALLGLFLSILITFKLVLSFVPGIELITFFFIIFSLFLYWIDLLVLICAFNLLIMAFFGLGYWEIVYWIAWPTFCLGTKLVSKITQSKCLIAFYGFFCGFSMILLYFGLDLIIWGKSFALANLITALPINIIEGSITFLALYFFGPVIAKIFQHFQKHYNYANILKSFQFKKNHKNKWYFIGAIFWAIIYISTIIFLIIFNGFFVKLKNQVKNFDSPPQMEMQNKKYATLTNAESKKIFQDLKSNQIEIMVIANHQKYYEKLTLNHSKITLKTALDQLHNLKFKYYHTNWGNWVQTFKYKNSNWKNGTSKSKNFNDYYPLIFVDQQIKDVHQQTLANLGISQLAIYQHEIIEFTYDFE